jgi:hypothetical protein
MGLQSAASRFERGAHLKVFRRGLYWHHGIYVGDDRVVQFGAGGAPRRPRGLVSALADKHHAKIEEVSLHDFDPDGEAVVVDQSELRWPVAGWKLPPPLPPERIVARARCLAGLSVAGAYNLLGNNCETVALWCVSGFGESLQRQRANPHDRGRRTWLASSHLGRHEAGRGDPKFSQDVEQGRLPGRNRLHKVPTRLCPRNRKGPDDNISSARQNISNRCSMLGSL